MTATRQHMPLEEYLNYDDSTDTRYTLVNRELVVTPPESALNNFIALYILSILLPLVPNSTDTTWNRNRSERISGDHPHSRFDDCRLGTRQRTG